MVFCGYPGGIVPFLLNLQGDVLVLQGNLIPNRPIANTLFPFWSVLMFFHQVLSFHCSHGGQQATNAIRVSRISACGGPSSPCAALVCWVTGQPGPVLSVDFRTQSDHLPQMAPLGMSECSAFKDNASTQSVHLRKLLRVAAP